MSRRPLKAVVLVGVLFLALACSDPLSVNVVGVDVTGDILVSPDEPATFRVTATNRSDRRVVWGMGSSSCQLGLLVRVDGQRHRIEDRVCTSDRVEQGLNAGQSRTEEFVWGGVIGTGESARTLDPGRYGVIGVAGNEGESAPLTVTVIVTGSEN